jgi:two-component system OmpR family response regulator
MKLLLIEDDASSAAFVVNGFRELGHVVDWCHDGRDGLFQALNGTYDVIVADRMMPQLDGLRMVKALRQSGSETPVIFLTALTGIDDRVEGLEAGADDYLPKPFAFSELNARVMALARRPPLTAVPTSLQVGDLELDLLTRSVRRGGKTIDLQPQEFRLLEYLVRNAGRVVTRTMLLEHVWDFHFEPRTTVVETHISRLRAKIDKGFGDELIHTVRGAGYVIRTP